MVNYEHEQNLGLNVYRWFGIDAIQETTLWWSDGHVNAFIIDKWTMDLQFGAQIRCYRPEIADA